MVEIGGLRRRRLEVVEGHRDLVSRERNRVQALQNGNGVLDAGLAGHRVHGVNQSRRLAGDCRVHRLAGRREFGLVLLEAAQQVPRFGHGTRAQPLSLRPARRLELIHFFPGSLKLRHLGGATGRQDVVIPRQTLEHPAPAGPDVGAEPLGVAGANIPELGDEFLGLLGLCLELRLAGWGSLALMLHQALVDPPAPWLDVGTKRLHVIPAGVHRAGSAGQQEHCENCQPSHHRPLPLRTVFLQAKGRSPTAFIPGLANTCYPSVVGTSGQGVRSVSAGKASAASISCCADSAYLAEDLAGVHNVNVRGPRPLRPEFKQPGAATAHDERAVERLDLSTNPPDTISKLVSCGAGGRPLEIETTPVWYSGSSGSGPRPGPEDRWRSGSSTPSVQCATCSGNLWVTLAHPLWAGPCRRRRPWPRGPKARPSSGKRRAPRWMSSTRPSKRGRKASPPRWQRSGWRPMAQTRLPTSGRCPGTSSCGTDLPTPSPPC